MYNCNKKTNCLQAKKPSDVKKYAIKLIFQILQYAYKSKSTPVLPSGRNFGRKSQNGPKEIVWSRENEGPNFWKIYQKRAELFFSLVLH
jgi:hypothetical protein